MGRVRRPESLSVKWGTPGALVATAALLGCAGQVAAPVPPASEPGGDREPDAATAVPAVEPSECEQLLAELEVREREATPAGLPTNDASAATGPATGVGHGRGVRQRWCSLSPSDDAFCEAGYDDVAALLRVVDACYPGATVSRPRREEFVTACRQRGAGPNVLYVGQHLDVFFNNLRSHIAEGEGEPCDRFCERIFAWNLLERASGRTLWRPRYATTREACQGGCRDLAPELQACLLAETGEGDCAAVVNADREAQDAFISSLGYQHAPERPLIDCSY